MSEAEEQFLKSLLATFKVEAQEHLQAIAGGLLALEKAISPAEQRKLIEMVFRAAHSLKGAARAVNLTEVERLCQTLEDVFAGWKRQGHVPVQSLDQVHRSLDRVSVLIGGPGPSKQTAVSSSAPAGESEPAPSPVTEAGISANPPLPVPRAEAPPPGTGSSSAETVRIPVSKLDAHLLEAEEMLTVKLAARQHAADLRSLTGTMERWHKEWLNLQPEMRDLRSLLERPSPAGAFPHGGLRRLMDFVEWNHAFVQGLETQAGGLRRIAEQDQMMADKLVDDLLEDSKKLLMLPLSTMGAFYPKLVRDLCRDQGKEAELVIEGEEVEMDKRILEGMKDPIMHLLRNSVDHGIEVPEVRKELGKPAQATITLAVTLIDGQRVEICVSDDGRGMDPARLRAAAVKKGLLPADEAASLSEAEVFRLVLRPDFSTSPMVTPVSGRGLGLAIVQEKAEALGGQVLVESEPKKGTTIRVLLPVTLATFRGVLVQAEKQVFVIPTAHVERVIRHREKDVVKVEGRETLTANGRALALVALREVLELRAESAAREGSAAVIIGKGDQRVALAVDAVLDEQEVLVKRFRKPLSRIRNVLGATVLGNGQVAPILEVSDLIKSARRTQTLPIAPKSARNAPVSNALVLVVEDSITSRMLLKGILESAGYRVRTAVDGMDAFTALKTEKFDVVVSDVEMPRMNGFDLTARIRADKKLGNLPVILVTALESREHRERGMEAGANAYLAKSSLDQRELLNVMRQLV